jgi:hypothetical protein
MRLEGLGQLKNPVTSGLDPATFRLVAQCLNQLRYSVRPGNCNGYQYINSIWRMKSTEILISTHHAMPCAYKTELRQTQLTSIEVRKDIYIRTRLGGITRCIKRCCYLEVRYELLSVKMGNAMSTKTLQFLRCYLLLLLATTYILAAIQRFLVPHPCVVGRRSEEGRM